METTAPTGTTTDQDLHRLVDELTRRVEKLEAKLAAATATPPPLTTDIVTAISAAVAAYLGKRATIRQIHFAHGPAWAQQGRAAIQASHFVPHAPRTGHPHH